MNFFLYFVIAGLVILGVLAIAAVMRSSQISQEEEAHRGEIEIMFSPDTPPKEVQSVLESVGAIESILSVTQNPNNGIPKP